MRGSGDTRIDKTDWRDLMIYAVEMLADCMYQHKSGFVKIGTGV
jgi:hypothetical protein